MTQAVRPFLDYHTLCPQRSHRHTAYGARTRLGVTSRRLKEKGQRCPSDFDIWIKACHLSPS